LEYDDDTEATITD
jgi:hypothetical protein